MYLIGLLCSSSGKRFGCDAGDQGSIPWLGRSSGEGNGNPLQYSCLGHARDREAWLQCSCLENFMDREAWWATVRGVTKSWTQMSDYHIHTHTHTHVYLIPR